MESNEILALLAEVPDAWVRAALARDRAELERIQQGERRSPGWNAAAALRQAHLWLAAGVPGLGDDLVLEADALQPDAGVIPDWWGLWPPQAPANADNPAERADLADCRALAASYVQLRHLPAEAAWATWRSAVQGDPQLLDAAALRLLLGVVIHGSQGLERSLEQGLAEVVGEELVAREPGLAWRLFDPLCERLPGWSYARLKAADLSLQRGELERCRQLLEAATAEQQQLPWLQDIAARLALARGEIAAALAAWQRAIEASGNEASDGGAALVELFRQRAREARRGPGLLAARSLLNRGDREGGLQLLEQLLEQDPQWQPLRSLRDQARNASSHDAPAAASTSLSTEAGPEDLQRLEGRLAVLAERAGLPWPPAPITADEEPSSAGWERFLQQALGRLALLG